MIQRVTILCHELRNTLNGIKGNAELLRMEHASFAERLKNAQTADLLALKEEWLKHIAQATEAVQSIETCAQQQKTLVDDNLQLSKLEAGKVELNPQNFTPDKVVHDVTAMLDKEIKAKNLQLRLELLQAHKVVNSDPARLKQVLVNLLSNAIKFTPEGGKVTVSMRQLEETDKQSTLQFEVKDTGIGMSTDEKTRIFTPFTQANNHIETEYGGSGLGLTISKSLVELMGGKIAVESEKWHGTCFTFTIPCKNVDASKELTAEAKSAAAKPVVKGLRVLIVEDNLINQKLLLKQLEPEDCHCYVASNGKEAIEIFQKNTIDVILMDIEMPVMNGLEASRAIRQLEHEQMSKSTHTLIVALSGNAQQDYKDAAMKAGIDEYLVKPTDKAQLLEKLSLYTPTRLTSSQQAGSLSPHFAI